MKKIAVLLFPGMNCEVETMRAVVRSGFYTSLIRWNQSPKILEKYDGVIFPGGFSFEDRGRSGLVSAKEPIINIVKKMANQGKPVLGICNGAQVLVESGLVPGFIENKIEMSLSRNKRISKEGEILGTGFYHNWVYIKNTSKKGRSAFNDFDENIILKMPVAHGEGRFIADKQVMDLLIKNSQNVFSYCDNAGKIIDIFPINPNGSLNNIAGVCNEHGNILAMMPHPERTNTSDVIFSSMHNWFENNKVFKVGKISKKTQKSDIKLSKKIVKKNYPIEFYISLKITDNTEKTIERALQKVLKNINLKLKRSIFWGIESNVKNLKKLAEQIAHSGEIFNENKENAICKVGNEYYKYHNKKFIKTSDYSFCSSFLAIEKEDFVGQEKYAKIRHHLHLNVNKISSGILWKVDFYNGKDLKEALEKSSIFANPIAGNIIEIK